MTTTITPSDSRCDRCDHDLHDALVRHMDEDGPGQCPRCGLGFAPAPEWLRENGYDAVEDKDACLHCGEDLSRSARRLRDLYGEDPAPFCDDDCAVAYSREADDA